MLGMFTRYNEHDHSIVNGDVAKFVARLPESDIGTQRKLFVAYYKRLGVYVVAEWLHGKVGENFVDVMNLGNSLSNFNKQKADELRRRLFAPDTTSSTASFIRETNSNYLHQLQDEDSEEGERLERCRVGE